MVLEQAEVLARNVGPHEGGAQADEVDGRLRRPQLIGDALDREAEESMDAPTALRIKDELVDVAGGMVRAGMKSSGRPPRLYHFTDCQGLVNILRSHSLWASLATGLSDDSEVRYGVDRATGLLEDAPRIDRSFRERIQHYLDPKNAFTKKPFEFDAYVISFCANAARSVHWLHYGRSGTGCAIGLDASTLVEKPFELAPVLYDENAQDKFLTSIVEAVWQCATKYGIDRRNSSASTVLFDVAAHSTAAHIWMAAPMLKSPAFSNEEEWRLITYDVRNHDRQRHSDEVPIETRFRVVAGRIVPYLQYTLAQLPVTEIILGASAPMAVGDPALKVLLRETVGSKSVEITKSTVTVRP